MTRLRWQLVFLFVVAIGAPAAADTTIVDENFDSYADDSEFWAVWPSSNGSNDGILSTDSGLYPGIQGQAVDHIGGSVNEYIGPLDLMPTATQNIVLGYDIFDPGTGGNTRMSVGLRSTAVENLLEMGFYNTFTESYMYRLAIWYGSGDTNWNPVALDPGFDIEEDLNTVVDPYDIQMYSNTNNLDMWHRWEATITPDTVTLTLDLFRDGLTNDPNDYNNSSEGVDAEILVTDIIATENGFNSLRIGSPSGITNSGDAVVFDNILLQLIDVGAGLAADFDDSGTVDDLDRVIWEQNFGTPAGGTHATGDADADADVDGNDFTIWQQQFGESLASGGAIGSTAIPEPGSIFLASLALVGLALMGRRK